LLARCDYLGIELAILESPICGYADTHSFATNVEALNAAAAAWCQQHGILYIPTMYRLGSYSTGPLSARRTYKDFSSVNTSDGLPAYGMTDTIHPTTTGLNAIARAIANAFKNRRDVDPRMLMTRTALANIVSPTPMAFDVGTQPVTVADGAIKNTTFATDAINSNAVSQDAADLVWLSTIRSLTDKDNYVLGSHGLDQIVTFGTGSAMKAVKDKTDILPSSTIATDSEGYVKVRSTGRN
jgi:hypothetical protein